MNPKIREIKNTNTIRVSLYSKKFYTFLKDFLDIKSNRKTYSIKIPYVRINYTTASKELIIQVHKILNNLKIKNPVYQRGKSFTIQINGPKNVRNYLSKIGFSNNRHLNKIRYLTSK